MGRSRSQCPVRGQRRYGSLGRTAAGERQADIHPLRSWPADTVDSVLWAKVRALVLGGTVLGSAVLGGVMFAGAGASAQARPGPASPVVVIGIPGLRWTDVSAAATPVLWRLAGRGSVGSLVVTAAASRTCPADAWL